MKGERERERERLIMMNAMKDWPNLKRSRIWYLLEDYFNVRFIVEDADVDTARDMKGDDDWNPLKMVDRSKDTLKGYALSLSLSLSLRTRPLTFSRSNRFEPNKPRLLCFAPHGMFPCTVIWMHLIPLWGRVFKRLVPYALTDAFTQVVPGMREVMQWAGGREITKEVMQSMYAVKGGRERGREGIDARLKKVESGEVVDHCTRRSS